MALYRCDVQYRIPWDEAPSGFYYCTLVHHFQASNPTAFDTLRDAAFQVTADSMNFTTRLDWAWIKNLDSGIVVQNSAISWGANTHLIGTTGPLFWTVYMGLYSAGVWVGYKRLRAPLRLIDCDGSELTADAWTYYTNQVASTYTSQPGFTNQNGVPVDEARISKRVHSWRIRHGTKRAFYRHYH